MIYLDSAATTKPIKEAVEAVNKCLLDSWGNPSSDYNFGVKARNIVEESRKVIADFINAEPEEIIFTSGACEANSLAICGYLKKHKTSGLITSAIEHKSIMNIANELNSDRTGFIKTMMLPVDKKGCVNQVKLEAALCTMSYAKTLVSIQYANNEIGTIQNIKEISRIVHTYGGTLHTDATQIIPDRRINVEGIDMLSFSGQKIGAPKGIGVLYVNKNIQLKPIIYGSQEKSLRGGTENVPYIAGLCAAIKNIHYPSGELTKYFVERVISEISDCYLVGVECGKSRLKNNASICFRKINGEAIVAMLDQENICVSSGSACNSGFEVSHVLKALCLPEEDGNSVIRFTFSDNSKEEIDIVIRSLKRIIKILKTVVV